MVPTCLQKEACVAVQLVQRPRLMLAVIRHTASPSLALITLDGEEKLADSHRREEITQKTIRKSPGSLERRDDKKIPRDKQTERAKGK